uniref:ATP synthase F0 subunit 8 n=1 Tax=Arrugada affinis TaxID=706857 RepID=UPI002E7785A1|nr:ATP synthase F0 subunit 8 [Arrugada affinis]WRK21417.1 ATP synthase F0 subunit 8 [Arrugada affinis]
MPQMAPMWWTFIMVMSIMSMLLVMINTYFSYMNKMKYDYKTDKMKMHWKW